MVYGVVLAGGIGSRMGNVDRPKQYLHIGKKPIIVHTVEKFIINDNFEKVIVLCPAQWITYTKDLFRKHLPENSNVVVIEGGKDRNGTIMNAIRYIEETDGLNEETSLVTNYYQGQTPQSFRAKRFKDLYETLSEDERKILTDAAKVFVVKGDKVALIKGETFNIKVTYPYDLQLAETLLGGEK